MGSTVPKPPIVVQKAIDHANKASFGWMDYTLLTVLNHKSCNETLTSLDKYGWDYVLYLFSYIMQQNSVEASWNLHQQNESNRK